MKQACSIYSAINVYTKLHQAVIQGNIKRVRNLVEGSADIRIRTPAGFNAAELSMHFDNFAVTKYLTSRYSSKEQQLLIHTAAALNNARSIRHLLKLGVKVNTRDDSGRTALHRAAQEDSLTCARVLVSNGALVDAYDDLTFTPLAIAVAEGHLNFVKFLLKNEAKPNRRTVGEPRYILHLLMIIRRSLKF